MSGPRPGIQETMKKSIPEEVKRVVKRAFRERKEVCGYSKWASFAQAAHMMMSEDKGESFFIRALADAEKPSKKPSLQMA